MIDHEPIPEQATQPALHPPQPTTRAAQVDDDLGFSPIAALPRSGKEAIVLISVAMGLVVYGVMAGWWGRGALAIWVAIVPTLLVGGFACFSLVLLRDRLLWRCLAWVAFALVVMNYSVWWLSGEEHWRSAQKATWLVCMALLLLIALAWVQAVLQSRTLRAVRYSSLFAQAWHNAMAYGLVAQFVGLCWLVLGLWAGLFLLVKVDFFAQTFMQPLFVCLATGLMAGVGVVLARGQPRALQIQLQLVLALFRVLLPMLSLVVVLFVLTLPFTGVQTLWETRKAALLLAALQLCLLLFVNAVYQDGLAQDAPYPRPVQQLVHAALLLWPVLGVLGVWAVALRVQQYGWTHGRVWALVATGLLLVYGLGYAWRALPRGQFLWLQGLGRFNAAMSWVLMAVGILLHTPLLDVYRLTAYSQLQRMQQADAVWDVAQLQSLRFDHGRHGWAALQALRQEPRATQHPEVQAALQQVLGASQKVHIAQRPRQKQPAQQDVPARERLQLADGHTAPPDDWWQALDSGALRHLLRTCRSQQLPEEHVCVVFQLPLSRSDALLPVVCRLHPHSPNCQVFERDAQHAWQAAGNLSWGAVPVAQRPALAQAIQEGRLEVQPSRWNDVVVPGLDIKSGQVR